MEETKEVIIDLNEKTDLLAGEAECPCCGHKYYYGVQSVEHHCNKCNTKYKTEFRQDIYTKKARWILFQLRKNNTIKFKVSEKYSEVLDHIAADFHGQRCYDVGDITETKETFRYCEECGVCLNCFKCNKCNKQFELTSKSKHRCPSCKSTEIDRPFIKTEKNSKGKRICPLCKSDKIKLTITKKDACERCKGKKLSNEKYQLVYWLTINRKGGYKL